VDVFLKILATLTLVATNAFFVAAEFAAVGARLSHIEASATRGVANRVSLDIKKRLEFYLSATQLGVTLSSLGLGAISEPLIGGLIEPLLRAMRVPISDLTPVSIALALSISTALHIVIGEQAPKTWAIRFADRLLPIVALPLATFAFVLYPVIWTLSTTTRTVLKWTGAGTIIKHGSAPAPTESEIRALIAEATARGTIGTGNASLLASAFDFSTLKARQIMTPRTQVDFLLLGQPISQLLKTVQKSAFTRLPLCDKDIDHVIGVIHMKDLFNHLRLAPGKLKFIDERKPDAPAVAVPTGLPGSSIHVIGSGEIDLQRIKRDVIFVPEQLPAPRLLRQFQTSHLHMAVVVDEYGATRGIVTMEDVLEEIVGEIEDEFDTANPGDFVREGDSIRVTGLYPLHELRDRIALPDLDSGEVDTVGGYIVQHLGRWPRPGDQVPMGEFTAKVVSVQKKRVGQVVITKPGPAERTVASGAGRP
jgi:CBS domain containing-hemolysin-like protein